MDKIGNIGQILEIIRSQTKAGVTDALNRKESIAEIKAPPASKRISKDELKKNISLKLKSASQSTTSLSISKDIFLEAVILWEFGDQLAHDPLFAEIKLLTRQTIDSNPDASKKMEKLIGQLINSKSL